MQGIVQVFFKTCPTFFPYDTLMDEDRQILVFQKPWSPKEKPTTLVLSV